jgi:hypothetical protein
VHVVDGHVAVHHQVGVGVSDGERRQRGPRVRTELDYAAQLLAGQLRCGQEKVAARLRA